MSIIHCKMVDNGKVLEFSAKIRQLAAASKSMNVGVDGNELAMAFLNSLPDLFDSLISALDALGDDKKVLPFAYVFSWYEQEEKRHQERNKQAVLNQKLHYCSLRIMAKELNSAWNAVRTVISIIAARSSSIVLQKVILPAEENI